MKRALSVSVAAALVASCGGKQDQICSAIPDRVAYAPPHTAAQVRENVNRCVQHWAARLSLGSDPAAIVARAAVAACQEGLDDALAYAGDNSDEGERRAWEGRLYNLALFRAVQQRAGDCGIPPLGEMPEPDKGAPKPEAPPKG